MWAKGDGTRHDVGWLCVLRLDCRFCLVLRGSALEVLVSDYSLVGLNCHLATFAYLDVIDLSVPLHCSIEVVAVLDRRVGFHKLVLVLGHEVQALVVRHVE